MSAAQDLANAAYAAGFRGDGLVYAVAIGLAESGGFAKARHANNPDPLYGITVDRGAWQINSYFHSEVTDACADDLNCAAAAVYRISQGGANWSQWATWTAGAYLNFLGDAQAAAAIANHGSAPAASPTQPSSKTVGPSVSPSLTRAAPVAGILLAGLALYELAEVLG